MTRPIRTTDITTVLTLTPPHAAEFSVYGDTPTINRAREWAAENRLLLASGIAVCAHGFYGMRSCPGEHGSACARLGQLDHADIWVPADTPHLPFLLSSPYARDTAAAEGYAAAHGLSFQRAPQHGWFGSRTLPFMLCVPTWGSLWPIDALTVPLLAACPISWPEDVR